MVMVRDPTCSWEMSIDLTVHQTIQWWWENWFDDAFVVTQVETVLTGGS
jgi:hypothetical protein